MELAGRTCYCVYYALVVFSLVLHSFSTVSKEQWLDSSEADQVKTIYETGSFREVMHRQSLFTASLLENDVFFVFIVLLQYF